MRPDSYPFIVFLGLVLLGCQTSAQRQIESSQASVKYDARGTAIEIGAVYRQRDFDRIIQKVQYTEMMLDHIEISMDPDSKGKLEVFWTPNKGIPARSTISGYWAQAFAPDYFDPDFRHADHKHWSRARNRHGDYIYLATTQAGETCVQAKQVYSIRQFVHFRICGSNPKDEYLKVFDGWTSDLK